jgi:drug/metabolite transporter (DMT)-like permease
MSFVGESAALATSVLWSGSSMVFTFAGRRIGSEAVNIGRLLVALAILMGVHLVLFGTLFPMNAGAARLGWLGISGLIGFALGDAVLFESFVLVGPRLAMLMMTTSPLFSALMGWALLDQRISLAKLLAMLVALAGIAWVVTARRDAEAHPHLLRGLVLGIGGALGQAVGLLFSHYGLEGQFHPVSANLVRVAAGSLALLLWFGLRGQLHGNLVGFRDRTALALLTLGAIIGPVLGVVLSLVAIAHTSQGVAATLMSLSPVLLLPLAHVFLGEKVGARAVVGTVVALVGSAGLFWL